MNKHIIGWGAVGVLILLLALTCPGKEAHVDKIRTTLANAVEEKNGEDSALGILGALFVSKVADVYLDSKLEIDNYVVCSVGKVRMDGETTTLSFGILNPGLHLQQGNHERGHEQGGIAPWAQDG